MPSPCTSQRTNSDTSKTIFNNTELPRTHFEHVANSLMPSVHSFGASHDGSQNAAVCTATDLNLMASKMSRVTDPTKARNPWTFSACSLNSIYEYVDKLTR